LCQDAVVTNVTILLRLKMGPVLATEGEFRQTTTHTASQQCVEANGAGAGASDNGKGTNNGAVGKGFNNLPNRSAFWVLKIRRNWYKSVRRTQEAD
jgi:hypothetical protein